MDNDRKFLAGVSHIYAFVSGTDPVTLIKSYKIIFALFYQVKPETIASIIEPLMTKVCDILYPSLVEYVEFANVNAPNVETYAVQALFNLFIFVIYNISYVLSQCKEHKVNFNAIYDRFIRLFIETKVDGYICKGITSKGKCLVFGGYLMQYTPSANYFYALATTIKHLVYFYEQNFNKLALCIRQLILIANAASLQHYVDIRTDIYVLLSQNKNLGFSILYSFSFIDELYISVNEENQQLFKLNNIIQSLQRLLFVYNYIDETRWILKYLAHGQSDYLFPKDHLGTIQRIYLGQPLEDVIDDLRRYLSEWLAQKSLSGDDTSFYLLANFASLPSAPLRLHLMALFKNKRQKLADTVSRLMLISKYYPEIGLIIAKALGESKFVEIDLNEFVFLAAKLSFCMARGEGLEQCINGHFAVSEVLFQDVCLLRHLRGLDEAKIGAADIYYIMHPTDESYSRMVESGAIKHINSIYQSMSDHTSFLAQLIQNPNAAAFDYLKSVFQISNRDEVRALKQLFRKTNDVTYMLPLLYYNPAYLSDHTIVECLSDHQILEFLQIAERAQKTQLEAAESRLREFERQQAEGITIDKNSDPRQIRIELQQKILQTQHQVTQLKKGNCAYFEDGLYWGLTELLHQTRISRHAQIIYYLKSVGYIK